MPSISNYDWFQNILLELISYMHFVHKAIQISKYILYIFETKICMLEICINFHFLFYTNETQDQKCNKMLNPLRQHLQIIVRLRLFQN